MGNNQNSILDSIDEKDTGKKGLWSSLKESLSSTKCYYCGKSIKGGDLNNLPRSYEGKEFHHNCYIAWCKKNPFPNKMEINILLTIIDKNGKKLKPFKIKITKIKSEYIPNVIPRDKKTFDKYKKKLMPFFHTALLTLQPPESQFPKKISFKYTLDLRKG